MARNGIPIIRSGRMGFHALKIFSSILINETLVLIVKQHILRRILMIFAMTIAVATPTMP